VYSIDKQKGDTGMETGEIQPLPQPSWSLSLLCITPLLQLPTWHSVSLEIHKNYV